jgi:hypothetical protein
MHLGSAQRGRAHAAAEQVELRLEAPMAVALTQRRLITLKIGTPIVFYQRRRPMPLARPSWRMTRPSELLIETFVAPSGGSPGGSTGLMDVERRMTA